VLAIRVYRLHECTSYTGVLATRRVVNGLGIPNDRLGLGWGRTDSGLELGQGYSSVG
jgi:hypothetical protein